MKSQAKSLLFLIFILLIHDLRATNNGLGDELRFLHREIGLLRDENQNQNKEIFMLKEILGFQNNKTISNQISSLIKKEIEVITKEEPLSMSTKRNQDPLPRKTHHRNKRPYRLIPVNKLNGSNNYGDLAEVGRYYGPPTNCSDLAQLGYTLNGFYLVQSTGENAHNNLKTETVYCAFKQPEGTINPADVEKRFATITLKPNATTNKRSANVHFFLKRVIKDLAIVRSNATILFTDVVFNMGGGSLIENLSIFTVPKNGIYQITFSLILQSVSPNTSVKQDDDGNITIIYICVNTSYPCIYYIKIADNLLLNRILLATLKLNRGDKIYTKIKPPTRGHFGLQNLVTFSGSLLEEL